MGMIEELADEIAIPEILAGLQLHPEIRGCIDALTALSIPFDAGAPTCRQALRDSGARFSNDTIAVAVRERRSWLSGTAANPEV
jgi:cytochrome c oxidase cbb3-type subunit II